MASTLKEQLEAGYPVSTFTSGVSMEPLLYDHKTHVIIEPVKRILRVGELPLYQIPDGRYVIHRIVSVGDGFYRTRGDNCMTSERIPKEWVLGVVVEIYRKGKHISVGNRKYRTYVFFWREIYPLRYGFYQLRYLYSKILRKVRKG